MKKANLPTRWVLIIRDQPKEVLNSYDKLISFTLKTYMKNETGDCFPTNKRIAQNASCDVKTVRKVLSKLVRLGFLYRAKIPSKSGSGHKHYHYKALLRGEPSSSVGKSLGNIRAIAGEPEILKEGNYIPPNYKDNYTKNSYSNNAQKENVRSDGFKRLSCGEVLRKLNNKKLNLND